MLAVMPIWNRSKDPLQLQMEAELTRLGTVPDPDDHYPIEVHRVRSHSGSATAELRGRGWNYLPFRWQGDAQEALEIFRRLPDNAGPIQVWSALNPTFREVRLWKELDRIGVTERKISESASADRCVGFDIPEKGSVRLTDDELPRYMDMGKNVARITGGTAKVWTGTVEDALTRIEPLADDCGLNTFWLQFPDTEKPDSS